MTQPWFETTQPDKSILLYYHQQFMNYCSQFFPVLAFWFIEKNPCMQQSPGIAIMLHTLYVWVYKIKTYTECSLGVVHMGLRSISLRWISHIFLINSNNLCYSTFPAAAISWGDYGLREFKSNYYTSNMWIHTAYRRVCRFNSDRLQNTCDFIRKLMTCRTEQNILGGPQF